MIIEKQILAIGPGQSTIQQAEYFKYLDPSIATFGMHRVFPYLKIHFNFDIDYWTWADPDAIFEGIEYLEANPDSVVPKIIIPPWFKDIKSFRKFCGTTPVQRDFKKQEIYKKFLDKHYENIIFIDSSTTSKLLTIRGQINLIEDPALRFSGDQTIFQSVRYDGSHSESNWAKENKFTSHMLPICHFLKASKVYCVGFDNQGTRISSHQELCWNDDSRILPQLEKFTIWSKKWKPHHNIDIISVAPDEFTRNNQYLPYQPLKDLLCYNE